MAPLSTRIFSSSALLSLKSEASGDGHSSPAGRPHVRLALLARESLIAARSACGLANRSRTRACARPAGGTRTGPETSAPLRRCPGRRPTCIRPSGSAARHRCSGSRALVHARPPAIARRAQAALQSAQAALDVDGRVDAAHGHLGRRYTWPSNSDFTSSATGSARFSSSISTV